MTKRLSDHPARLAFGNRPGLAMLLLAACMLAACRFGESARTEETATFPTLYDSLSRYDRAVIVFEDAGGRILDTVHNGPVDDPASLRDLPVENWDGGKVVIHIVGFKDGKEVYRIEKHYDGRTGRTDSTLVLLTPDASLGAPVLDFLLLEGDSLPLPEILVRPAHLSEAGKALDWSSSHPDVAVVGATHIKVLRPGMARITVRLRTDESRTLALSIRVEADARVPERIAVSPDTLRVAAGGASFRAEARAFPATARAAVVWSTDDPGMAMVGEDGTVRGLRRGETRLRAVSKERSSVEGSAVIQVTDPVPVETVRFLEDSTRLYLGGAPESLVVEVLPREAGQAVDFASLDPAKAAVHEGNVHALAEGLVPVVVASRENPGLADTLWVRVLPPRPVDSVRVSPRRLRLFTGGEAGSLSAQVHPPAAPEAVRWTSGNAGIARVDAAGKVIPVSAGDVRVYATSAADSLARDSVEVSVRVDAPVVSVGGDTVLGVGQTLSVLPVVAPQEYGLVTAFKWDMDGDLVWDDSAAAVRTVSHRYGEEKTHSARFLVRDTEGNETVARKQVRVVNGRAVQILAPRDNSYSRESRIAVRWSVDGVEQDSLTSEALVPGINIVTRSFLDSGRVHSASIAVILDTLAPDPPLVRGPAWVRTSRPAWTWSAGGSGGAGVFRTARDREGFLSGAETHDTLFVPDGDLAEGSHTLYVQERDAAGNWSESGRHTVQVDLTPPARPDLTVEPGLATRNPRPTFRWTGGGGGMGHFQFRLGAEGSWTPTTALIHSLTADLSGVHVFQVRERDSAGHWSAPAAATVTIDLTPPKAPQVTGATPTSAWPRWSWTSGGDGGSGDFRFKVDGDGNPANGGTETRTLEHVLPAAVSGVSYTLHVQERDAAGNWSAIASHPIVYDLTRPAVAIRSPQVAGTFLTQLAAVDVSGTSSKPEGGSPIQSITYTLDGVAGTLPTNLAADGTWIIRALPLVNGKTLELKVTATDQGGSQGEAVLFLAMDSTPPAPPVFSSQPPSLVDAADSRSSLEWTWTRGAATDSFLVRLNGTEVARQAAASYSVGSLADGTYALQVAAFDAAGNLSAPVSATVVTVDRTPPPAPNPSAVSPTRDNTPTWTWTAAGGGPFEYRLAREAAPTGVGVPLTSAAFTPPSALEDGLWQFQARERDASGNWSAWSAISSVVIKATAPAAPVVARNAAATSAPRWTWSGGGGGNGTFRYRWAGAAAYLGEGTGTEFAPAGLAEQSHSLCVSERDVVGYGTEGCQAILVDRTPPVIAGYNVPDGFITNRSSILIGYTKDGAAESFSCDLTDGASKVCQRTVSDAAGNSVTVSRTIWHRSNVVFVKAGGTGARDGSSWADAVAEIDTALVLINGKTGRFEIWVAQGHYQKFTLFRSYTSLYGGFSAIGHPTTIQSRDPIAYESRIRGDSGSTLITIQPQWVPDRIMTRDVTLDGFHIRDEPSQPLFIYADNLILRNFWIERNRGAAPAIVQITQGTHVFEKVFIRENYDIPYSPVFFDGQANLTITDSEISDNRSFHSSYGGAGIVSSNGGRLTLRRTKLNLNRPNGPMEFQAYNDGRGPFDIDECAIQDLRNAIYPLNNDTLVIWGTSNTLP